MAPKKPKVNSTPATKKSAPKKNPTKATSKAGTVNKEEREDISDKPAGNTRAADKKRSAEVSSKPAGKTVTDTAKKSNDKPPKARGKTSAATREPTPEPDSSPSEEAIRLPSPKRKRETADKWTETTDLPVPKYPKLDEGTSPSPSRRSREIRTLKEFASEGYGIQGFGRKICCVDTVDLSRIPSPFADLGDRAERLLHIVDLHAYEWVRRLFHNMYGKNTARLIDRLEGRPPGCPPGAFGFYQHETKINTGTPYLFFMRPDLPKTPLPLKKDNETTANISLDFRVLKNAKSDEMDYFVVNEKKDVFIINEKMIGKKLAAGPLPDFAVILVGCYVVFWWRTQAALDYMPEAVSQSSKEMEEGGAAEESSPSPPNSEEGEDATKEPSALPPAAKEGGHTAKEPSALQKTAKIGGDPAEDQPSASKSCSEGGETANEPPRPPSTWKEILHEGLATHCRDKIAAGDRPTDHQIPSFSGMTIDDVLFAVATFWQALRNQGKHFAFGGTDTFDQNVQQLVAGGIYPRVGVVGEGNRFIMPLFFPPDPKDTDEEYKGNLERKKKEKNATLEATNGKANAGAETPSSPLGHLLLAVAEKDSPNSKKLDIRIFDSRNITLHRNVIRRRATKLTRDWSEMNAEPHFDWRVVPQQIGESNACGLYVIFNAWAVMLGIEPNIKRSTQRGGYGTDREFLVQGLAIVNLALAGFMDSRTIMAFLNYYGYTEVVDLLDRGDEVENAVIAVRMDSTRFNLALRDSDLSSTSSSPDSARRTISTEVEEALVESMVPQFMENAPGATREEAKHYLTITEDIQEAVTAYMMDQSQAGGIAEAEPS